MATKQRGSSARGARARKNAKRMPGRIDFSDIPESTDEELARARRVGRPKSAKGPRRLIAMRIDPDLLRKLRKMAVQRDKPYQTLIHELLARAVAQAA